MEKVDIIRLEGSDQGSVGRLIAPGFSCWSLELPCRDNRQNISCIPRGEYEAGVYASLKFGRVYVLKGVPDRSGVLLHNGVWAGDVAKNLRTHSWGCLLLGYEQGYVQGQRAVWQSRFALREFMEHMGYQPIKINIVGGVKPC